MFRTILAIGIAFIPGPNTLAFAAFKGFAAGLVASGGDMKVALIGALTAGAFHGVGSYFQSLSTKVVDTGYAFGQAYHKTIEVGLTFGQQVAKSVANGVVSGVASAARGGNFVDGLKFSIMTDVAKAGFEYTRKYTNRLARLAGREVEDPLTGELRTDGVRGCHDESEIHCKKLFLKHAGMAAEQVDNPVPGGLPIAGDHFYNDMPVIRALVNKVSKVHDFLNSWGYNKSSGLYKGFGNPILNDAFDVYSFAGMLPAAAFTGAAHLGGNTGALLSFTGDK